MTSPLIFKKKFFKTVAVTTTLSVVMLVVVTFFATFIKVVNGITEQATTDLVTRTVFLIVTLLLLALFKFRHHQLFDLFLKNSFGNTHFFRPFLLVLAILFIGHLFAWHTGLIKFQIWGTDIFSGEEIVSRVLVVWMVSHLISALAEELFYRGVLLNHIQSVFHQQTFSVLFSAILFSISHHQYRDFTSFFIAFLAGMVFGFYYLKFRSITGAVGIHFGYNLFYNMIASEPFHEIPVPFLISFDFSIPDYSPTSWFEIFKIVTWLLLLIYICFSKPGPKPPGQKFPPEKGS